MRSKEVAPSVYFYNLLVVIVPFILINIHLKNIFLIDFIEYLLSTPKVDNSEKGAYAVIAATVVAVLIVRSVVMSTSPVGRTHAYTLHNTGGVSKCS